MKQDSFLILNGKYRLFVCGNEIGINLPNQDAAGKGGIEPTQLPWYKLGDWDTFKREVEVGLRLHATATQNRLDEELSGYSIDQLQDAINRRLERTKSAENR